jgi:hypothetical protein
MIGACSIDSRWRLRLHSPSSRTALPLCCRWKRLVTWTAAVAACQTCSGLRPIPSQHLHAWMSAEPVGQWPGLSPVERVDRRPCKGRRSHGIVAVRARPQHRAGLHGRVPELLRPTDCRGPRLLHPCVPAPVRLGYGQRRSSQLSAP